MAPFYFKTGKYNLTGVKKFIVPKVAITTFGLSTFQYLAISTWNSLPDETSSFKRSWSEYFQTMYKAVNF